MSAETKISSTEARLVFYPDSRPGWTRRRYGRGFAYFDEQGAHIADPEEIARIRRLAIPPAYRAVWISPRPNGHLQATGRDARGRKQYRYHERYRAFRDERKYERLCGFARELPRIRRVVAEDLARPKWDRDRVAALCVRLLDATGLRVGSQRYVEENGTYGLTTLQDDQVKTVGRELRIAFIGKGGRAIEATVEDAQLVRWVRRLQDLPGQELFTYRNADGEWLPIGSHDINAYLAEKTGMCATAKDFRLWRGTVLMTRHLVAKPVEESHWRDAVKATAAVLQNTAAVCAKYYLHPEIRRRWENGELVAWSPRIGEALVERRLASWLRELEESGA